MDESKQEQLDESAAHEAGHAVLGYIAGIEIERVRLLHKSGGKSGEWNAGG